MRYFEHLWSHPEKLDSLSERSLLLSLSQEEITTIFTRKRLELVRVLKEKKPESISSAAEMVKRDPTAVERDLRILKGHGVVEPEKFGRTVRPRVPMDFLILPLVPLTPYILKDLEGQAAGAEDERRLFQ